MNYQNHKLEVKFYTGISGYNHPIGVANEISEDDIKKYPIFYLSYKNPKEIKTFTPLIINIYK